MANESSYNSISSLVNNIQEGALLTARDMAIVQNLVTSFSGLSGSAPRILYSYTGGTVEAALAETTDMSAQTFTPAALSTLTPVMLGAQYFITDQRLASDWNGVQRDAATDLGQLAAVEIDSKLVGLFNDLTGGTVGTAGGTLTWANFLASINTLRVAKAPLPYVAVLAPGQWYHLANSVAAGQTVTNAPALQDAVARQYFAGNAYGVDVYLDANITSGTAAYGAMFSRSALALDVRRAPRIEVQRDASRGGGGWELNLTAVYAAGLWRPTFGVSMCGSSVVS